MKTAEEMAMEYLGTDPRKRTGETLASLLLLYGAQVREEACIITRGKRRMDESPDDEYEDTIHNGACEEIAAAIRNMELP